MCLANRLLGQSHLSPQFTQVIGEPGFCVVLPDTGIHTSPLEKDISSSEFPSANRLPASTTQVFHEAGCRKLLQRQVPGLSVSRF